MNGFNDWPIFDDDVNWENAQAALVDAGLSDGLPLVVPTTQRVTAMLDNLSEPDRSHGQMPPLLGELTGITVAYNCVLAGCPPGAVPTVLTASTACLEPNFNLLGLATTTGSPAISTIVHGPVAAALEMNDGVNCLGPGNRANATLGRALSLVLRNVAGMRASVADMATMGQPGKYGLCFPEARVAAFQPFHARRGMHAEDSAVTVVGASGTVEVLPSVENGDWSAPEDILKPVASLMKAAMIAGGGARKPEPIGQMLLLPPELATLIKQRDWTIEQTEEYLSSEINALPEALPGNISPHDIYIVIAGGPGIKMTVIPLWGGGTRPVTRALIQN